MKSRYFAFGCSFVNFSWPTLADLIGANFDEYYNLAVPGGCNTLSCSRLMEIDDKFSLNPNTDFVTVGVTGYGRYSFGFHKHTQETTGWLTAGDCLTSPQSDHPYKSRLFVKELDNYDWAVYRSWIAIKTIAEFLKLKKIKYQIYPSLSNLLWGIDYKLNYANMYLDKINSYMTIKESLYEFSIENEKIYPINHPSTKSQYLYLQKYFKEYDSQLVKDRYNYFNNMFKNSFDDIHILNKISEESALSKEWADYCFKIRSRDNLL